MREIIEGRLRCTTAEMALQYGRCTIYRRVWYIAHEDFCIANWRIYRPTYSLQEKIRVLQGWLR